MRTLSVLAVLCIVVVVASAKKSGAVEDAGAEPKTHGAKKYAKEHQKPHHFNHKKHDAEELVVEEAESPRAKNAPAGVAEPEEELQQHLDTGKKSAENERLKDLHLQDLAYEESLEKEKRHHRAESEKQKVEKAEKKLFADQESKQPKVDKKVIEDSFEPLEEGGKAKKHKKSREDKQPKEDKKSREKTKGKKAYEKTKDKGNKKHKDGKKNKDKHSKKEKKH